MAAAVQVRLEIGSLLADDAALREAEHLKPAAVGEDRVRPADKAMEAAAAGDQFITGAEKQVIRVGEHDLGARFLDVAVPRRLHRALRADGHEGRRLYDAVRRLELAEARRAVGRSHGETESRHPSIILRMP